MEERGHKSMAQGVVGQPASQPVSAAAANPSGPKSFLICSSAARSLSLSLAFCGTIEQHSVEAVYPMPAIKEKKLEGPSFASVRQPIHLAAQSEFVAEGHPAGSPCLPRLMMYHMISNELSTQF